MGAHRGVDSAPGAVRLAHRLVQGFPHPVQALELEVFPIPGHVQHRRHRVGVVGRELRIDAIGNPEEPARAREVGDVGARLAGEHGKAVEAEHLGALHLGVPVRAFTSRTMMWRSSCPASSWSQSMTWGARLP